MELIDLTVAKVLRIILSIGLSLVILETAPYVPVTEQGQQITYLWLL